MKIKMTDDVHAPCSLYTLIIHWKETVLKRRGTIEDFFFGFVILTTKNST